MAERPWVQTYSGKHFSFAKPEPEQIELSDIAHALSNLCRYTGHVTKFYSVAHHSIIVAGLLEKWGCDKDTIRCGLMHDAPEAYINDVSSPLKTLLPDYKAVEDRVAAVVMKKFGIPYPFPDAVKKADVVAGNTERRDLMGDPQDWVMVPPGTETIDNRIEPLAPEYSLLFFLDVAKDLGLIKGEKDADKSAKNKD